MSNRYQITKPLSQLPPAEIKTFKITSDRVCNFVTQNNGIVVAYSIHNHTGGAVEYRINNENDTIDLKSLDENMQNVQIERMEFIGVSDIDLIVQFLPLPLLRRFNALEVG